MIPALQFGRIRLEQFQDMKGIPHSYISFTPTVAPQDYYFTHQFNAVTTGPLPSITFINNKYKSRQLTQPAVASAFKAELRNAVQEAIDTFEASPNRPELDEFSKDELSRMMDILQRGDSFIQKDTDGEYLLTIPHSSDAVRGLEGLPRKGTLPNNLPETYYPGRDDEPTLGKSPFIPSQTPATTPPATGTSPNLYEPSHTKGVVSQAKG